MTQVSVVPRPATARSRSVPVGALVGIVLGVGDLALQHALPYPWANLANSSAVWALVAFAVGLLGRTGWPYAAAAGALTLVVAVEAYYVAAILFLGSSVYRLIAPSTVLWVAYGVLAGALLGAAGSSFRTRSGWISSVALALPGAVLLGEAARTWVRSSDVTGHGPGSGDLAATAVILAALGIVVPLVAARRLRPAVTALLLSLPLGVVFFAAYTISGYGG